MIKKLILLFCCLISLNSFVSAQTCYNCAPAYEDSSSSLLTKISGIDYFTLKTTETVLEKYFYSEFNSKINFNAESVSAADVKAGRFKKITAKSKQFRYKMSSVSDTEAYTVCPYNRIIYKDNQLLFPNDIPVHFTGVITNDDLSYMFSCSEFNELLNVFNSKLLGGVFFKIVSVTPTIFDNKIRLSIKITSLFTLGTPIDINLTVMPSVKNGQIIFSDPSSIFNSSFIDINKLLPSVNIVNPLSFLFRFSKNTCIAADIEAVALNDNKIIISGLFIIPKNYDIN